MGPASCEKQFDHFVLGGGFRISGANIDGSTSDCAGLRRQYKTPERLGVAT